MEKIEDVKSVDDGDGDGDGGEGDVEVSRAINGDQQNPAFVVVADAHLAALSVRDQRLAVFVESAPRIRSLTEYYPLLHFQLIFLYS